MKRIAFNLIFAVCMLPAISLFGWGRPHPMITKVAVDRLPQWQKDILGKEGNNLIKRYCWYPDMVYSKTIRQVERGEKVSPAIARAFELVKPARGKKAYCAHRYNKSITCRLLLHYMPIVVENLRKKNIREAMEHFGIITHFMEDASCPAHTGKVIKFPHSECYYRYVQSVDPSFKYPSQDEWLAYTKAHRAMDNCPFSAAQLKACVGNYKPKLLGENIEQIAQAVTKRMAKLDKLGADQLPLMVRCIIKKDTAGDEYKKSGLKCAEASAKLIADALYSLMCMAYNRYGL